MTPSETNGKCGNGKDDPKKIAAYLLVGFSVLLTLRVGMNGSIFCMKRFRLPEHLFSLYVSRVHNAIELSGFAGVTVGTIYTIKYNTNGGGEQKCEKVSIGVNWLFFAINIVLLFVYVTGGEEGHLTDFYWTLALSAFVYGLNLSFIRKLAGECTVYYLATLHVSGIFSSVYHFLFLRLFGNKRKYDTDFHIITWQIILSILITGATAGLWTSVYHNCGVDKEKCGENGSKQDESNGSGYAAISPVTMCIFAQGVVYVFYPAIAPGLLVDFRHVTKIDQALLIIAPIPSITFAILDATVNANYSPKNQWSGEKAYWNLTLIFIPIMIICGYLFIRALHYPYSAASLAIMNKPGVVGFLAILFYVSHMVLLSIGYPGVEKNWNSTGSTVTGFLATFAMIIFVFLSEGYINEFKKHDRAYWPTTGLSNRRAFGFWFDKALQNGFKNFLLIFSRDLRRDLLSALD
ncbi:Tpr family protein [Theileria parva strain Muguga]|uniref:Uncharacterized protein n=1 Tax=Theileria parva TaxID=5875 RepID=Q4N3C9_THEPA|nr:uncharacterized protein TpMuguga_04g00058 [Theileria parva strain Muguga]EAN31410.1 Tpr family protein [Theileria parva strain Muguga]|eukprot:XP_763693.1 hypothetical protein [Theileria parva strain Muguga]